MDIKNKKTMIIDTHAHLDGEEFRDDLHEVIRRSKEAGVGKVFLPAIDLFSTDNILKVCKDYAGYCHPMTGLHPEEVKPGYGEVLTEMHRRLLDNLSGRTPEPRFIAVGEVGLDFYWSREFQEEQLKAFEEQVRWSIETRLPLMIHCRKAQNELLHILSQYKDELPGGVFHCFTGNQKEALAYLEFGNFVLGIGGVSTFKSSHLREDLPACVPLDRIVLETDSPYMAPVPHRGVRNESAFVVNVQQTLADCYGVSAEEVAVRTNANVLRVFGISV
ncbi:TatD family hydrolase [Prevotella dentasini JCM 15908]